MQGQQVKIAGEVVGLNMKGPGVRYSEVCNALNVAGLDESVARVMVPKNAFSRAKRKLEKNRVITEVDKTDSTVSFQFTQEVVANAQADYVKEDVLVLDLDTGRVHCLVNPDLERLAQDLVNQAIDTRTGSDLGNMTRTLFKGVADLIPVLDQGGAYIVPGKNHEFLEKVSVFAKALGRDVRRFPILAEDQAGDRSIQECMKVWVANMIGEHARAIEGFDGDTRESTMERRVSKIRETRLKVESYAEYLKDNAQGLLDQLGQLQEKLVQKVEDLATEDEADEEPAAQQVQESVNQVA